jgi:chromate transporter
LKHGIRFYLKLFVYTFQLSAFTFGGGYVIIPMMKKQFVEKLNWIDEKEMLDFTAIAQSTPGAMAVNASVLLGFHLSGIIGALITILGTVLPPLLLLSVISAGYTAFANNDIVKNVLRGLQTGVCAVIIDAIIDMSYSIIKNKKIIPVITMFAVFIAVSLFSVNVIYIIIICGLTGLISIKKKEDKHDLS